MGTEGSADRKRALAASVMLGLAALALVAFWPVTKAGFVHFDDDEYLVRNPRVAAGLSASGAAWAFRTTLSGNWMPLTWLSLLLDVRLFGLDAGRMHQVNLLIHGANGVLLFLLLRALTGALWRSALVAALFLAHPLHVESVAWVSERKDVLSAFFWLLGLGAYLRAVRRPGPLRLLPVTLLLALGLMAKAMPVTFPLTALLLDRWPLGRLRSGRDLWPRLREKAPLVVLAAAAAAVAVFAQGREGGLSTLAGFPLPVRLGNAVSACGWYLGKALWPARLAFFYPHPGAGLSWTGAALTGAALAAGTALALALRRRPCVAVGWLWYLVTLLPVLGIVQVGLQATADRYSYVPLTGLFLLAVWGAGDLARRSPALRAAAGTAAVACLVALAAAARAQAGHWADSRSLSAHAARVAPSWMALLDLGIDAQLAGSSDDALAYLRRARDLNPANVQVLYNLAWVHEQRREWEPAVAGYRQAALLEPRDATAPTSLGALLVSLGRSAEAVPWLERALRLAPDADRAHGALGGAYHRLGDRVRAERHLAEAVRLNPGDGESLYELGVICFEEGRTEEATAHLAALLRLDPGHRGASELLAKIAAARRP
jgi:Flp pilus assembly protein TadD